MTRPLPDIEAELAAERRQVAERWVAAVHSPTCHRRTCECGCCSCGATAPRLEPAPAPTSQRWLGRVLELLERFTERRPGWATILTLAFTWTALAGLITVAAWALGILP